MQNHVNKEEHRSLLGDSEIRRITLGDNSDLVDSANPGIIETKYGKYHGRSLGSIRNKILVSSQRYSHLLSTAAIFICLLSTAHIKGSTHSSSGVQFGSKEADTTDTSVRSPGLEKNRDAKIPRALSNLANIESALLSSDVPFFFHIKWSYNDKRNNGEMFEIYGGE